MMIRVPVVIEPYQIEHPPRPHVPHAFLHVANGPVMMQVLESGPDKAKPAQYGKVMQGRNLEKVNQRAVQQENERGFKLHPSKILWIERFLKRGGRAVQF